MINLDYSPRRSGKTTRLIHWIEQDKKRLLITFNSFDEERLKKEYPHVKNQILSWFHYQLEKGKKGIDVFKECSIDNAELVLSDMVRQPIKNITISNEEYTKNIYDKD